MNADIHDEVREIIATGSEPDLSAERQAWLRSHLRDCPDCREFATMLGSLGSALQAGPAFADGELVRQTQERVHARSFELRQREERNQTALFACIFVALSSVLTMPVCWKLAEWVGARLGVANLLWQMGFGFFWVSPVLAAAVFLMARNVCWGGIEESRVR